MTVLGLVLVALAAVFHVFVFVLESVLWTRPSTMRTFGIATHADAVTTLPLALNQGFYNLFLAIVAAVGIVLVGTGASAAGFALVIAAAASMIGAALVLIVSNPRMARAALMQGGLPAVGLIALGIGALV